MKVGVGLDALQGTTCMLCRNVFMHDDAPCTSLPALDDSQAEAGAWSKTNLFLTCEKHTVPSKRRAQE